VPIRVGIGFGFVGGLDVAEDVLPLSWSIRHIIVLTEAFTKRLRLQEALSGGMNRDRTAWFSGQPDTVGARATEAGTVSAGAISPTGTKTGAASGTGIRSQELAH